MFKNVLILCHANICRSPAAEHLLQQKIPDIHVQSAGLYAMPGLPAASDMIELMNERNINLNKHRSRQVTAELIAWSDLILVMEEEQQKDLGHRFPTDRGKIHRLGKWDQCDIPDPFQKPREFFEENIHLMDKCLSQWQTRVWREYA